MPTWCSRAPTEDAALAEADRPRVQALGAVVLEVEERVEEVEAGHPERDRAAERPRLPRQLAGHRRPRADRREAERRAEPLVAEPGDAASGTGRRRRARPAPARASGRAGRAGRRRRGRPRARRAHSPSDLRARERPAGSSRDAVRGLRASSSASISRLSPIASVRAPTIATVIQSQSRGGRHLADARAAPPRRRTAARRRCARASRARRTGAAARGAIARRRSRLPVRPSRRRRAARARARAPGRSTAKPSRQPPGEPGRLTTSVRPWMPATPRESSACGVFAIESARIASAIPGASRSSTERVASGVTSRGATPGAAGREHERRSAPRARRSPPRSRRPRRRRPRARPRSPSASSSSASRSPLASSRVPGDDAVRDGEHGRLHTGSFVFSTSATSPTTISLSIAFAMS